MTDQKLDALLLEALLEAMPDAVLMSDAHGIITKANRAVGNLFDHDPKSLIGVSVNILMPQGLAGRHDRFM